MSTDDEILASLHASAWSRVLRKVSRQGMEGQVSALASYAAGIAHAELGRTAAALDDLADAVRKAPDVPLYLAHRARILAMVRRFSEAGDVARRALDLPCSDHELLDMVGVVLTDAGDFPAAANAFRRASEIAPEAAAYRFHLGYALLALGDDLEAQRQLEHALQIDPRQWRAHLSLALMRRWTETPHHLALMRDLLARHSEVPDAQIFLNIAIAKELEDLGEFPAAFSHYAAGKAAVRKQQPYQHERDRLMFRNIASAHDLSSTGQSDATGASRIFVIGMPRSGTTLLERMISRHHAVHGGGELHAFPKAFQEFSRCAGPALFDASLPRKMMEIDWSGLGAAYLRDNEGLLGRKSFLIDKMPHNFLYAGFIARALPGAKIICIRRNPLDVCLSNFKHLFAMGDAYYDYANNLLDIGRYFRGFDQLMDFWHRRIPGRILEVNYEDLVTNPEATLRTILDHCGLEWDERVLTHENSMQALNTPKAWQVRSPLYRSAVGSWQSFKDQLGELRALLASPGDEPLG